MLFSVICIILCHSYCNSLSISVTPGGEDGESCLRGETPCRSLEYPAQHLTRDYIITISAGDFVTNAGVTITEVIDGQFIGAGKTTTVKGSEANVNAVFLVEKSSKFPYSSFIFLQHPFQTLFFQHAIF